MQIIKPNIEILSEINSEKILTMIEKCGRVCYKSEDKINPESSKNFVKMLISKNHLAMIEHCNVTTKVVCDRGVSHEIVRHRIASYAQESTRYVNYTNKGMQFIIPSHFDLLEGDYQFKNTLENVQYINYNNEIMVSGEGCSDWNEPSILWLRHMLWSEKTYNTMIKQGQKPQEARSVLPNSLKTEIIITMNLREWMHFFKLRTDKVAHPDMQVIANMILHQFQENIRVIFDDFK